VAPIRAQAWYDSDWQYRKAITIDGTQVVGNHSAFPVLISLTDGDLAASALGSGYDILFTDDDGTTKLDYERQRWVSGTGELIAWVKIPSLTSGVDKTIYLYYGNGTAPDQQNAAAVWSNGYEAVYHLDDDFTDATGNHAPGVNAGSVDVPGLIGDGQDFERDNNTDHIDVGSWSVAGSQLTIQSWVRFESFTTGDGRIISKALDMAIEEHVFMLSTFNTATPSNWRMRIKTGTLDGTGTTTLIQPANTINLNTWYLTAATYDGATMRLLQNGGQVASVNKTGNLRQNGWSIYLGNNPLNGTTNYKALDATLDEVRISSAARSSGWLTTEYNNQRPGATFYGVGPEQAELRLSSASSQTFWVGKAATAISAITISEAAPTTITAANDIRIRIPTGFNMSWDVSDLSGTLGGNAVAKVSSAVSYEDGGKTLVVDVTNDFAVGDTITISDIAFMDFTAASGADNLELEVYNDGTVSAIDDKTVSILPRGTPTISSEEPQAFRVGEPPITISTITVRDDAAAPAITAANDIRIRIPAGFNMSWDVSDATASIFGTGAGKVSNTVGYEDGGKTLVIDVTADFDPGDLITIADLSFASFTGASLEDNLELEIDNDGAVTAVDDKGMFIVLVLVTPSISSSANQNFQVGDPPRWARMLRIDDDDVIAQISAANDIRIRIPGTVQMTWDVTDGSAWIVGRARSKVSNSVSYEDGGKTLVIDVTTDFAPNDWILVLGLRFANFSSAGSAGRLELEVDNNGVARTIDDKTKQVHGGTFNVDLWPESVAREHLPSNGTNYAVDFTVSNIGSGTDSYDLLTSTRPGGVISVVSITGSGVSQAADPDSARLLNLAAGERTVVSVTYAVAGAAGGTIDTLLVLARSVSSPAQTDEGRLVLTVIRPSLVTTKSVTPNGTQLPGTDLTYSTTVSNAGSESALSVVVLDSIPTEVQFKVGSVTTSLPPGVSFTTEYSDDGGAGWAYAPVSQGCGAPTGYDGCITHIRWTLLDPLSFLAAENSGTLEFTARIK
jgi:uncharacterized repeat protein (TIGR01451 family)